MERIQGASSNLTTNAISNSGNVEMFYLMGLRINGKREVPDFYTFLLEQNGVLHPLVADGQIVLFRKVELYREALQLAGIDVEFKAPPSEQVSYLLDVAAVLYLLMHESIDEEKRIPNLIDYFARALTTMGIPLPPVFEILSELGTSTDEDPFFGTLMNRDNFNRERCIDGIRWCLGTLLSVATIL